MSEPQQRFSLITDKSLGDLRKLVGVPIEDTLSHGAMKPRATIFAIGRTESATTTRCGASRRTRRSR